MTAKPKKTVAKKRETLILEVTPQGYHIIQGALAELPYKLSSGLLEELNNQVVPQAQALGMVGDPKGK